MEHFLSGRASVTKPGAPPAPSRNAFAALAPERRAAPGVVPPAHREAKVEVIREGDLPRRIVVTCLCGERVELECLY